MNDSDPDKRCSCPLPLTSNACARHGEFWAHVGSFGFPALCDGCPRWLLDQQLAFQDICMAERLLEQQAQAWLLLMPQRLQRQRAALSKLRGYEMLWEFFCETPVALRAMVIEGRYHG